MLVFMFPGQGSQRKGMGRELFDDVPQYRAVESQVNTLLGYSLRELCCDDAGGQLNQTQFTQPAIYVVNALHYYKAIAGGAPPQFLVGHSLGEYNALLAAGAFDLLTGLRLVKKRGELMSQAKGGSMVAVIGLAPRTIQSVLHDHALAAIDVANFNSPTQTVLSGPESDLKRCVPHLEQAGARTCAWLPVSASFHSRYMVPAARAFDEYLRGFTFQSLTRTVVANATGRPYPQDDPSATIRTFLVKQICEPVRWVQSIEYLARVGAREFREIGTGAVLTQLHHQQQQTA